MGKPVSAKIKKYEDIYSEIKAWIRFHKATIREQRNNQIISTMRKGACCHGKYRMKGGHESMAAIVPFCC